MGATTNYVVYVSQRDPVYKKIHPIVDGMLYQIVDYDNTRPAVIQFDDGEVVEGRVIAIERNSSNKHDNAMFLTPLPTIEEWMKRR
jgi:hypothetical protein